MRMATPVRPLLGGNRNQLHQLLPARRGAIVKAVRLRRQLDWPLPLVLFSRDILHPADEIIAIASP